MSSLAVFYFDIYYRCGKANGDADGLFRIPVIGEESNQDSLNIRQYVRPFLDRLKPPQESAISCSQAFFQAVYLPHSVNSLGDESSGLPAVEVVGAKPEAVDNDLSVDPIATEPLDLNLVLNWADLQRNDPNLAKMLRYQI